jgi:hypothetical protein
MDRRSFLRVAVSAGVVAAADAIAVGCSDDGPATRTDSTTTTDGRHEVTITPDVTIPSDGRAEVTRYGPLAASPDENGLLLPAGFTSELLAVGGETVSGTSYRWHPFPDGGACFAVDDGGWIYVNNSES